MEKINTWLRVLVILSLSLNSVLATNSYCQRIVNKTEITKNPQTEMLCKNLLSLEKENSNLSAQELASIKRIAAAQISILDRVKNLEDFYLKVKSVVDGLSKVIDTIGKFIGLPAKVEPEAPSSTDPYLADYHHLSGTVMSPGSVAFTARTGDGMSFDKHDIDELEMDVYYNKNLFVIDKIVGSGLQGKDYSKLVLPAETRSSRDRIQVPLSDVLTNQTTFYIYLAPLNGDLAQVGDQTKVNIRYYKRVDPGELAPVIYELKSGSTDTIKIIAKSPV